MIFFLPFLFLLLSVSHASDGTDCREPIQIYSGERNISTRFDESQYYNKEEMLKRHFAGLLNDMNTYEKKIHYFNLAHSICSWGAGLSGLTTTIISILGASDKIDATNATVAGGSLAAGTTFMIWAAAQCRKNIKKYSDCLKKTKESFGIPKAFLGESPIDEIEVRSSHVEKN
jgi:hypothetical protein